MRILKSGNGNGNGAGNGNGSGHRNGNGNGNGAPAPLKGRKVWMPRLTEASARAMAAVFRSFGLDADVTPPSDERTRELGARYTCGDECYPTKVTLGDFLKVLQAPGADPSKIAFFMASGQGPCRFGQYVPYMRAVLSSLGYADVPVLAPTFESGYADFGDSPSRFVRSAWRAIVAGDIVMKLLLKTRPYEAEPGSADAESEAATADLCRVLEARYANPEAQLAALRRWVLRTRTRFRSVRICRDEDRPLIGVVGEIFCRLNAFSNDDLVRRLEAAGAAVWMNDVSEWIWYTNDEQARILQREGKGFSARMLSARIRAHYQKKDEQALLAAVRGDLSGYEEPEIGDVLANAEPYLPSAGSSGEMVLNVGKAVHFARKGLDGVIDISPFTCMNGIICEAIYPRISQDHSGIPIRNFYFDGTESDLERDIGIFLELARNYGRRKPWKWMQAALA
jgi:predicted nucleotide-binding protein (sugar kinase/HSP70/actin superfamily)